MLILSYFNNIKINIGYFLNQKDCIMFLHLNIVYNSFNNGTESMYIY